MNFIFFKHMFIFNKGKWSLPWIKSKEFESYFCPSSLAKGFAHGPLSLHPWQIELDFVISADRHLTVFTSQAYKDDISFDQWVLLTVSCLGRCQMAAPSVYISTAYTWCFRDRLLRAIWLDAASSSCIQ